MPLPDVFDLIICDADRFRVDLYRACGPDWRTTAAVVDRMSAKHRERTLRTAQRELVRLERLGLVEHMDTITGLGHTNIWRTTDKRVTVHDETNREPGQD